jgi:hypothetical protein
MPDDIKCAPWAQTYSGRAVDLLAPQLEQIDIKDIAMALNRLPRFNGHTLLPWSVAAHSVAVERELVPTGALPLEAERLAALLHDAHEAYTGDIISPMQAALSGSGIKTIQAMVQQAIHARFGLPRLLPDATCVEIKRADLVLLATEKDQLMSRPPRPWMDLPAPSQQRLDLGPWADTALFEERFVALMRLWHRLDLKAA